MCFQNEIVVFVKVLKDYLKYRKQFERTLSFNESGFISDSDEQRII